MLCSRVFVVPEAGIEPATQVSTTELLRQNWRKMMESNHQPSLAGTVFKTACAPCAPSSVVGAAGIEPATSCSQSKRATAALRPENGCWAGGDPGFPLVMVIVQACPRRSRQPAIWHQVTSRITAAHCQPRIQPAGHSEAPPYRARLAAASAAVTLIGADECRIDRINRLSCWSGWAESNRRHELGRLLLYH